MKEFVFHYGRALFFLGAVMNYTVKEVKQFVEDNDVKFIKLTFCDTFF